MSLDCSLFPLSPAKVLAIAKDSYLTPTTPFKDLVHIPAMPAPMYGQDITFGKFRIAPKGHEVGTDPEVLKDKMRELLKVFASNDKSGMAARLFEAFLDDSHNTVTYFDDPALNLAASNHPNIRYFCNAALSAPGFSSQPQQKVRIHQALKKANWDIGKMYMPTGLGVPAFNNGDKAFGTEDFGNGLGVMINGVQYVYVIATHYQYDPKAQRYCIRLKYVFFDVFGLDDDDLDEYGAKSDSVLSSTAAKGITAWWQLQHQFGHAPLVTRIVVEKTYDVAAI